MRNKKAYRALLRVLEQPRNTVEWDALLQDLLTPNERESLTERWQIVQLLANGMPQRDIADKLGVSISKITRGSRVLQEGKGGFLKALQHRESLRNRAY
ncbi:MAG: Trp family transcriptional regulator [Patescibacteria group bacterium]